MQVVLGVGVAMTVVGVVLIPLPGPGLVVLTTGAIVAAVAAVLQRKGPERT
jgi:GMP synthase PP-ATPase subunit